MSESSPIGTTEYSDAVPKNCVYVLAPAQNVVGWFFCEGCERDQPVCEGGDPDFCGHCASNRRFEVDGGKIFPIKIEVGAPYRRPSLRHVPKYIDPKST